MLCVLLAEAVLLWVVLAVLLFFKGTTSPPRSLPRKHSDWGRTLTKPISWGYSLGMLLLIFGLVVLFGWFNLDDWLRLVMLNRYGLALAALHVGFVPLALFGAPTLLRSLLAVRGWGQLFNISWLSVLAAFTPMMLVAITQENASARFGLTTFRPDGTGEPVVDGWGGLNWLTWFLLAFPLPYACLSVGAEDRQENRRTLWVSLVLGLGFGLVILAIAQIVETILIPMQYRVNGLFPFPRFVAPPSALIDDRFGPSDGPASSIWIDGMTVVFKWFGRGYWSKEAGLARGHAQVVGLLVAGMVFFIGSYLFALLRGRGPSRETPFPPVFFVLMVLLLSVVFLHGLAFWLDSLWISPIVSVLAFSMLMYLGNKTDHFFDLNCLGKEEAPAAPPLFTEAITKRVIPQATGQSGEPGRTLVCITAAGGGIQASAWVARVLVGLEEQYEDISKSIGLISAVSGGSVGTMFYLDALTGAGEFRDGSFATDRFGHAEANSIRDKAQASSLEATAWGVAYPDLIRVLFPPAASDFDDRGVRIEIDWRNRLFHKADRTNRYGWLMSELRDGVLDGTLPITVFNATIVETGQRMLLWPFLACTGGPRTSTDARELMELYPRSRLPVSTAARLSATFSYVSPICRPYPSDHDPRQDYHYCDGGYVDNEGMVTLIELVRQLLKLPAAGRTFDRILLVRIQPFPTVAAPAPARTDGGWLYSTLGPLEALQQVRVASQAERNSIAVSLLQAATRDVPIEAVEFVFDPNLSETDGAGAAEPIPLNWMLTDRQKARIDTVWRAILAQGANGPLRAIDKWFTRKDQS